MPVGNKVRPKKWTNVIDLYDNGWYSAIWGNYDNSKYRCLGVRYNGEEGNQGYPNLGKNPLWFVEPDFTTKGILLQLKQEILDDDSGCDENISIALSEFEEKIKSMT